MHTYKNNVQKHEKRNSTHCNGVMVGGVKSVKQMHDSQLYNVHTVHYQYAYNLTF